MAPAAGGGGGGGGGLSDLLHAVAVDGPECGIHLLAATSHAGRLDPDLVDLFPTRLVLQTEDEAQSVRLIGRPDAAMLEEGGDLLFTLDGRAPRRLRGFRVSHQGLGALLRLLKTSFGAGGAAVLARRTRRFRACADSYPGPRRRDRPLSAG